MRRREFITLVGSAAVAWPFAVSAQQGARVRRIAVLSTLPADDPIWQIRIAAFHQALGELGWTIGRNIQIEYSVSPGNDAQLRRRAAELVALAPEVILSNGTSAVQPMMDATRSVPIVFINVTDPSRRGVCREPGAAGRQHYRFCAVRVRHERKMAGTAQANCAEPETRSGAARSHDTHRHRAIGFDNLIGAIVRRSH